MIGNKSVKKQPYNQAIKDNNQHKTRNEKFKYAKSLVK